MNAGEASPQQAMLGLERSRRVGFYQAVEQGGRAVPHVSMGFHSASRFRGQAWHQGNREKELIVMVKLLRQHALLDGQKDDLTSSRDVQGHPGDPVCSPAGEMKNNFL